METGIKLITSVMSPMFVYSSLWPSWLFAASSVGCKNVIVCIEDINMGVREAILGVLRKGDQWMECKHWKESLITTLKNQKDNGPVTVLLQGSHQMIEKVLRWILTELEGMSNLEARMRVMAFKTTADAGKPHSRPAKRRKQRLDTLFRTRVVMGHELVGGVLDHAWTFECSDFLDERRLKRLTRPSEVQSEIHDYLSQTKEGLMMLQDDVGAIKGKVAWKKRDMDVICRNVFVRTGWVKRKVELSELLDVYDVGMEDRRMMMTSVDKAGIKTFPREFTQQVPVRLLIRCLEEVVVRRDVMESCVASEPLIDIIKEKNRGEAEQSTMEELEKELIKREKERQIANLTTQGVSEMSRLRAKNDDAGAAVENWNRRIIAGLSDQGSYDPVTHDRALDALRKFQLIYFRNNNRGVMGSFRRFMTMKYGADWLLELKKMKRHTRHQSQSLGEMRRDYEVGMDAVARAINGSFWDWDDGSTVMFWRWPQEVQGELRDGIKVWFREKELPSYWGHQRWPENDTERAKLKEKLLKVVRKNYIVPGHVKSLTGFFAVPKGLNDIRIVYDASKSGLNEAIWSPNFFLPTISSVLGQADDSTYFGDIDLGEMFLNYFLDPRIRDRAGVDVTELAPEIGLQSKEGQRLIMRWERSLMGVRSSPFNCVKVYLWGEDIIRGDRLANNNVFRWIRLFLIYQEWPIMTHDDRGCTVLMKSTIEWHHSLFRM